MDKPQVIVSYGVLRLGRGREQPNAWIAWCRAPRIGDQTGKSKSSGVLYPPPWNKVKKRLFGVNQSL